MAASDDADKKNKKKNFKLVSEALIFSVGVKLYFVPSFLMNT